MTITKYPQSTILIESAQHKILIDPGSFCIEKYKISDFGDIDGVFITHQHFDHLDIGAVKFWSQHGTTIFGNFDVVKVLAEKEIAAAKIEQKIKYNFAGFTILPIDLPHCKMLDGSDGPPNTGYLINNLFFHPGDGIEIDDLKVDHAAVPITGPTIDYDRAWNLVKLLGAKQVVPMHYSNPKYKADPKEFKARSQLDVQVVILEDGQSFSLN